MTNVYPFPRAGEEASADPLACIDARPSVRAFPNPARPEITYGLFTIARFLGVDRRGEAWKRDYVQALIDQEGFPAPLPLLVRGELSKDIHPRRSQWPALAVRAWFLAQSPCHAVARVEDAAMLDAAADAANRLDQAAEELFRGQP